MKMKDLLNRVVMLGEIRLDRDDNLQVHYYGAGKVTNVSPLEDGTSDLDVGGKWTVNVRPDKDDVRYARGGHYTLHLTGEKVRNPHALILSGREASTRHTSEQTWQVAKHQIQFPASCARCAAKSETLIPWETVSNVSQISALTALTILYGSITLNEKQYSFSIPVCEACEARLTFVQRLRTGGLIACALLVLVGIIISGVYLRQGANEFLIAAVFTLLMIAVTFIAYRTTSGVGKSLGEFDGQRLRFKNVQYNNRFAALYPALGTIPDKLLKV